MNEKEIGALVECHQAFQNFFQERSLTDPFMTRLLDAIKSGVVNNELAFLNEVFDPRKEGVVLGARPSVMKELTTPSNTKPR